MDGVLVVLAHQDDEYFALPWIAKEIAAGNDIACVFLTDGGTRTDPDTRNKESLDALCSVGVRSHRVAFLGTEHSIHDGSLSRNLGVAYEHLETWLEQNSFRVARVYSPDYEGGHPDHDAAHLIAFRASSRRGVVSDAWSFSLYNCYRSRKPVFRTLRIIRRPGARFVRYSIVRGFGYAMFCWRYRSQRRTWLGLFPESFLRRVFLRTEWVNPFDGARLRERPHDGELLYEWMFGARHFEFSGYAREFLRDEG